MALQPGQGGVHEHKKHSVCSETPMDGFERKVPKDTGWAWMCLLGCFVINLMVVGIAAKSFGVLFVEFRSRFGGSAAATSWIVALSQCLALTLGPLANMLSEKFTSRWVVFSGGVLMGAGFIASMFAPSLAYLYVTYGVLVGLGSALAYAPSIVTVAQYFERRRALANGIAVAGGGVGNFMAPPLINFLLDYYGLQGTLLILAGLMFHVCICGLLLRPLSFYASVRVDKNNIAIEMHRSKLCKLDEGYHSVNEIHQDEELDLTQAEKGPGCARDETDSTCTTESVGVGIERANTTQNNHEVNMPETIQKDSTQEGHTASLIAINSSDKKETEHEKRPIFDYKLLKNSVFLMYGTSVFLAYCGYPNIFMIVPAHAMKMGLGKKDAAFLVSIIGIFDLIGRIGFGWFSDLNLIKKEHSFVASMALSGLACTLIPVVHTYLGLAILCAIIGLFAGSFVALIAVILAETLGIKRLPSAFGLIVLCMGSAFLFAPSLVGYIGDVSGTWNGSFIFCGSTMLAGSLVVLCGSFLIKM